MNYKSSNLLTSDENSRLDLLSSLLRVAPLREADYTEYVNLCAKAHRKAHSNGYAN